MQGVNSTAHESSRGNHEKSLGFKKTLEKRLILTDNGTVDWCAILNRVKYHIALFFSTTALTIALALYYYKVLPGSCPKSPHRRNLELRSSLQVGIHIKKACVVFKTLLFCFIDFFLFKISSYIHIIACKLASIFYNALPLHTAFLFLFILFKLVSMI